MRPHASEPSRIQLICSPNYYPSESRSSKTKKRAVFSKPSRRNDYEALGRHTLLQRTLKLSSQKFEKSHFKGDIIVDDGSQDETRAILNEKYADAEDIRLLFNQKYGEGGATHWV